MISPAAGVSSRQLGSFTCDLSHLRDIPNLAQTPCGSSLLGLLPSAGSFVSFDFGLIASGVSYPECFVGTNKYKFTAQILLATSKRVVSTHRLKLKFYKIHHNFQRPDLHQLHERCTRKLSLYHENW